jgi:hypothetical protein
MTLHDIQRDETPASFVAQVLARAGFSLFLSFIRSFVRSLVLSFCLSLFLCAHLLSGCPIDSEEKKAA